MVTSRATVALLYRRAGFGGTPAELDLAEATGFEATVDRLLAGLVQADHAHPALPHLTSFVELNTKGGDTYDEFIGLIGWWLDKMAATTTPLREKLTLLLHGQFPTGFSKVGVPIFMYHQNELFRTLGNGSFGDLTMAIAKDPAMLIWLDADTDSRTAPNENFARELMERFTMGIGNYTQTDVEESARAFTGWTVSQNGNFEQNDYAHDFGEKSFLGQHGDLDGEDVVRIVTNTGASARWVTSRLWSWLAYPVEPNDPVVTNLVPQYRSDLNVTNLLRAIFNHPNFVSEASMTGLVKQPVEWVAGIMRGFGLRTASFHKFGGASYLQWVLSNLGQTPFDPPSVGGWGQNEYWLSTATSLAQLNFATTVTQIADVSPIEEASGPDRIDVLGNMLGVVEWSNHSRAVLNRVRDTTPDLVTIALTAPEVVAN